MQGKLVGRSAKIHYVSRTTYLCSSPVCCGNTEDGIYVKMRNMAESGREKINQELGLLQYYGYYNFLEHRSG